MFLKYCFHKLLQTINEFVGLYAYHREHTCLQTNLIGLATQIEFSVFKELFRGGLLSIISGETRNRFARAFLADYRTPSYVMLVCSSL